jgi:hypothetical protein
MAASKSPPDRVRLRARGGGVTPAGPIIALDPDLGTHVREVGRVAFIKYFIDNRPRHATKV